MSDGRGSVYQPPKESEGSAALPRGVVVALGLCAAMLFERLGHFATRGVITLSTPASAIVDDISVSVQFEVYFFWVLAAGVVGIWVGPRAIVLFGAALAACAPLLRAVGFEPFWVRVADAVGSSSLRVGALAVAVIAFSRARAQYRVALVFALLSVTELGGYLGPIALGALRKLPFTWVLVAVAALLLIGWRLASIATRRALAVPRLGLWTKPTVRQRGVTKRTLVVVAIAVPCFALNAIARQRMADALGGLGATAMYAWGITRSVAVLGCQLAVCLVFVLARRVPKTWIAKGVGIGLMLTISSVVLLAFTDSDSLIAICCIQLALSLGDLLVDGFGLVLAAGEAHPRQAPLVVASWIFVQTVSPWILFTSGVLDGNGGAILLTFVSIVLATMMTFAPKRMVAL